MVDVALFRPAAPDGIGDLFRGRVTAIAPALGGAFVSLGDGPDGFLPDAVDVGQREQLGRVLGLDRAAVEDAHALGRLRGRDRRRSARMNAHASCACSGVATLAGADRPDRLVGDRHLAQALVGTPARSSWT